MWVVIGVLLIALFNLFQGGSGRNATSEMSYSAFIGHVDSGNVSNVVIQGDTIKGRLRNGKTFQLTSPKDPKLVERLIDKKVSVRAEPKEKGMHPLLSIFVSWLPIILIIAVWIFFMRQMQSGGRGGAMGFG